MQRLAILTDPDDPMLPAAIAIERALMAMKGDQRTS